MGNAVVLRGNIQSNEGDSRRNYSQEYPELGVGEYYLEAADKQQIVKVEINTEYYHKCGDDPLAVRRVGCNAVGFDAKASRTCGTERVNNAVEKRHSSKKEHNRFDHGEHDVYEVKNSCGVLCLGNKLSHNRARNLRSHNMDGAVGNAWDNGHYENDNSHTAYPVSEASPEEDSMAEGFNIREDRSSCGGKSADGLKKRINVRGDLAAQPEGQSSNQGESDPGEGNYGEAFFGVYGVISFSE